VTDRSGRDRQLLHASDDLVDLDAGQADIAVRYGTGPFDGLVAEPLLAEHFGILASPRLDLTSPSDLKRQTLLHTEWKRPGMAPDWRRWARLAGMADLAVGDGLRFTDDAHALQAAIAGHGVAIGSLVLARPEIDADLLIHPFGPTIDGATYHVVATPETMACADIQAVTAWLRKVAQAGYP
jgi:LysR family glycine cleavage system transcriptional activator